MKRKTKNIIKTSLLVIVIVAALMAIVMSATNPKESEHRKALSEQISKYDMSQINLTEEEQALYDNYMSSGVNANIMDKVIKPLFDFQDYGLWSVGYIRGKDYKKKVSFGIFNKVILTDDELMPQVILDAYRSNANDTTKTAASGQVPAEAPQQQ